MLSGIGFGALSAALIMWSGVGSSTLVANERVRRLTIFASIIASALAAMLNFEALAPSTQVSTGVLLEPGDSLSLNSASAGVLTVECRTLEGVELPRKRVQVVWRVAGDAGSLERMQMFQIGDNTADMYDPLESRMAASHRISAVGDNAHIALQRVSKAGVIGTHIAFHPERFPFNYLFLTLAALTLLGALFEGAAPAGWQRTFLTVILSGVTTFIWLNKDGFSAEDSIWTVWIRLVFATMSGAAIGTFLPSLFGRFLPTMAGPAKPQLSITPANESNDGVDTNQMPESDDSAPSDHTPSR